MPTNTMRLSSTGLISGPRMTTLAVSVLVALCSGTNYVYSAYGPQLGARLGLTHTQQNMVGLSGNMGVYSTAPPLGKLVDAKGPRIPLILGLVFTSVGYFGIKAIFDAGSGEPISTLTLVALILCSYMTGAGGNGGLTAAVNTVARSFPDQYRTTATGIVLSGFGLSAFVFSAIAHIMFSGNTSNFLLTLAIGTSSPMILGLLFIRPIPPPNSDDFQVLEYGELATDDTDENSSSQTDLLSDQPFDHRQEDSNFVVPATVNDNVRLSPTVGHTRHRSLRSDRLGFGDSGVSVLLDAPNVSGRALFATLNFWLLLAIVSILSGTGLMWINNVGSITHALLAKSDPDYTDAEASAWQSKQVSAISLMNFSGRIAIGDPVVAYICIIADFTKNRLGLRRTYCISLVSLLCLSSQLLAITITDVRHLYRASSLLGFAHGSLFGLSPSIAIEWFGLPHFSENWGLINIGPLIGGNLFSLAFGKNLDSHVPGSSISLAPTTVRCLEGVRCYVSSLYMTVGATFVALLLSIYAGWRDRMLANAVKGAVPVDEVVWIGEEED